MVQTEHARYTLLNSCLGPCRKSSETKWRVDGHRICDRRLRREDRNAVTNSNGLEESMKPRQCFRFLTQNQNISEFI